ncbi:hypothetical protein GCM10018784_81310 [Streptomyces hydrogenans]|nr:hypothetical protein GCM10018784_81310 [Streptomyces hydrogenans]
MRGPTLSATSSAVAKGREPGPRLVVPVRRLRLGEEAVAGGELRPYLSLAPTLSARTPIPVATHRQE